MQTKNWYQSKTVWFNIIMTVIGVVTSFQGMATLQVYAPYFAGVLAVGNTILRVWFTNTTVS